MGSLASKSQRRETCVCDEPSQSVGSVKDGPRLSHSCPKRLPGVRAALGPRHQVSKFGVLVGVICFVALLVK
jgi:hypothetical protein